MKITSKTALFLIITYLISFSMAGLYSLLGGTGTGTIGFTI